MWKREDFGVVSQKAEHLDHLNRGGSETKDHEGKMAGRYHWPRLVFQQDLLEPTIEESGDGEGGLGTINGRRHYLNNGCCVANAEMARSTRTRGFGSHIVICDTGVTRPLP